MSDQAVKSVKAVEATQAALKRQSDAHATSLKQQLAAIDQTQTRFQAFVGRSAPGASRVNAAFTAMGCRSESLSYGSEWGAYSGACSRGSNPLGRQCGSDCQSHQCQF